MTTIGVIGLGYWGSKVIEEYVDLREEGIVNRVVACDQSKSRMANVDGVDAKYQDIGAILNEVDGLHICTPNKTHAVLGTQALRSGTDVLIEKPLTPDSDSSFELMQVASEENRIIQTGHIFRFANVIQTLRDLYNSTWFGTLEEVTLRWTHHIDPPGDSNVLWDLAPHPIDILNFVTDDWPSEMGCRTRTDEDGYAVAATAQFEIAGANAIMQVSWRDRIRRRSIEVCGIDGSARIDAVNQTISLYDENGIEDLDVTANNTIKAEARNFVDAIGTRKNTLNSAVVGVRTVQAIEALERAAKDE